VSKLIPQQVWEAMAYNERTIIALAEQFAQDAQSLADNPVAGADPASQTFMRFIASNMRKATATVMVDGRDADPEMWARSMFLMFMGASVVGSRGAVTAKMAQFAKKFQEAGQKGGAVRAKQLTAQADAQWRDRARKMIPAIRAKNPGISQDALATKIGQQWPDDMEAPPHASLLKNVIRPIYKDEKEAKKTKT